MKQTKKQLRNNDRTLSLHTENSSRSSGVRKERAKTTVMSRGELVEKKKRPNNNIEQTKSDRIKQNYMDKYRIKDKEVKKSMRQDKRKWVDHLNIPIPYDPLTYVEIDPTINEFSTDPITKAQIRTMNTKTGKQGQDEITAELLKADMNTTDKWLVNLFGTFCE